MRNPFFHGVGGVLSADIAVPDHERELGFYSQVKGVTGAGHAVIRDPVGVYIALQAKKGVPPK